MKIKSLLATAAIFATVLTGCASVPTADPALDAKFKEFKSPEEGLAGLYLYRKTTPFGAALKKTLYVDKKEVGETAIGTYFYFQVKPGEHEIATESEFSPNAIKVSCEEGKNTYVEQYIKLGLFVGGANLKQVDEAKAQDVLKSCKLAQGLIEPGTKLE